MRTNGIVNWKGVSTLTKAQNYELTELLSNLALQENCILEQFIAFWDKIVKWSWVTIRGNANFSLQMRIVSLYWEELWGSRWRISILRSRFIFRTMAAEGQRHTHIERRGGDKDEGNLQDSVIVRWDQWWLSLCLLNTWDSNGKWQRFSCWFV